MRRVKKAMAIISILAFIFGGTAGTAFANPSQVQETASEGEETGVVNDGLSEDVEYFNTENEISANWDFGDNGCEIEGYKYRVIKLAGLTPWQVITDWLPTNNKYATVDLLSLDEGETYIFKVIARGSTGPCAKAKSNGQTLDTVVPVSITNLSIANRAINDPNVVLNWSPSFDAASGVENYGVYRSMSPFVKIGEADEDDTTFIDAGVIADNVNVGYKLIIWDEAGNSSESNIAYTLVDDIAPAAPIISYCRNGAVITINWQMVNGASNYIVYRDGAAIPVGGALSYLDNTAKKGETHSYYVVAADQAGNVSPASNTLVIYIPRPRVSSISTAEVLGAATGAEQVQAAPSEVKADEGQEGQVEASEESKPEEDAEEAKTNWSLIIAIIIAAAIVIAGVLYWWYAREDEEDEI